MGFAVSDKTKTNSVRQRLEKWRQREMDNFSNDLVNILKVQLKDSHSVKDSRLVVKAIVDSLVSKILRFKGNVGNVNVALLIAHKALNEVKVLSPNNNSLNRQIQAIKKGVKDKASAQSAYCKMIKFH